MRELRPHVVRSRRVGSWSLEFHGGGHVEIKFDSRVRREVCKIEFQAPLTYSIYRHTNHVESNLRGGISNLRGGISNLRGGTLNLRIFDINPATKFEYGGKSNLVAPDLIAKKKPSTANCVTAIWSSVIFTSVSLAMMHGGTAFCCFALGSLFLNARYTRSRPIFARPQSHEKQRNPEIYC